MKELKSLGGLCSPEHPDCPRKEIYEQQAEQIEALEKSLKFQIDLGDKFQDENARLDNENELLKEFAHSVIKQQCWGYDSIDGFDVQDLAERLDLIQTHIATEADVDPEHDDYEVGDIIYKFTDILAAPPQKGE